jgi:hypothetical protein
VSGTLADIRNRPVILWTFDRATVPRNIEFKQAAARAACVGDGIRRLFISPGCHRYGRGGRVRFRFLDADDFAQFCLRAFRLETRRRGRTEHRRHAERARGQSGQVAGSHDASSR